MVHGQSPDRSLRIRHGLIRDDVLCARRLEIEAVDVSGFAALLILRFDNHFVLIDRRLDEIGVILGISVFEKLLNVQVCQSVRLQLQFIQIDAEHGSIRKIIRRNGCEAGKLSTLGDHLLGDLINLISISARDRKCILPLVGFGGACTDLQNRIRSEQRDNAWDLRKLLGELSNDLRDWRPLAYILQESVSTHLIGRQSLRETSESKRFIYGGILSQNRIDLLLQNFNPVGRNPLLTQDHATDKSTIAIRDEGLWQ